jgi:hypothetical protein
MDCDAALESIEAVAAGDLVPAARLASHQSSSARCRTALAGAREIERLLRSRAAAPAPPQFTSRTLARIRMEWWRSEQIVDAVFNLGVAAVFLAVVVAGWIALRSAGIDVDSLGDDVWQVMLVGATAIARRVALMAPAYGAAALLLASAIVIWWWAEREFANW